MTEAWERVGSDSGGTVAALCDTGSGLMAATSVGVFRSSDAGASWTPPSFAVVPPLAEGIAASADFGRDRTVFVSAADGLYRSTDGGETWHAALVGTRITCVACLQGGVVIAGTEADGVVRSGDGGRTWESATAGLLSLDVACLAAHGTVAFAGTASGLHRTRNSGRSWRPVTLDTPIQCVALSSDGALVFAGTEHHGLFRSIDGGTSWQSIALDQSRGITAVTIGSQGEVAAALAHGIAISPDRGASWRMSSPPPGSVLALAITANTLLAGLQQDGLVRSVDDGRTWTPANAGLNARLVTAAAFAPGGALFVADIDSGIRVSVDHGKSWRGSSANLDPPVVSALAMSAANELFASTSTGVHISRDHAQSWSMLIPSSAFDGAEVTAIARAPDADLLVATRTAAEGVLWRSGGNEWLRHFAISGDHRLHFAVGADGVIFVGAGNRLFQLGNLRSEGRLPETVVTAIAVSKGTVYVGATTGVYTSQDGGRTFEPWSDGLPTPCRIVALCALDNSVYAVSFGGIVWRRASG